jgi:hypothetical protein
MKCPHQGHYRRRREVLAGMWMQLAPKTNWGGTRRRFPGSRKCMMRFQPCVYFSGISLHLIPAPFTIPSFSSFPQVCEFAMLLSVKKGFTANLMIGLLALEAPGPLLQHEAPRVALQETGSCKNRKQYNLASVHMTGQ